MSWNVEQLMTSRESVVVAYPETPFKQVVELMHMRDVSALPVVDSSDRVLGIVSEADLLLKEELHPPIESGQHHVRPVAREARRSEGITAADVMTAPAITIEAQATVVDAARLMHDRRVKRLPVVDARGKLLGIVSRRDLLTVFLRADTDIEAEVKKDLRYYLWLGPEQVHAAVWRGVVTLSGRVETRSLADLAGRLAGGIAGVVGVTNELQFSHDDRHVENTPPPLAEKLAAAERGRL